MHRLPVMFKVLLRDVWIFTGILGVCVLLSFRTYWHFGWYGEALAFALTYAVFIVGLIFYVCRYRKISFALLLGHGLFLSCMVIPAEWRFFQLKKEREILVHWLDDQHNKKGNYPAHLLNYPGDSVGFNYYPEQHGSSYLLYFSTARRSVCHFYRPEYSTWQYGDD